MRASQNPSPNEIDLAALPAILARSAKALLLAAAGVGLLTYGALLLVPSRYTSEAQIGILAKGRAASGTAEMAALQVDREAIASRVQELRSPDLARQLAKELNLSTRPEFNSALDSGGLGEILKRLTGLGSPRPGETEEERVLAAYYKALQVYQVKDTRVITLSFTAHDGQLAAAAANRLIDLYQAWLRQQGVAETTDANAWLAPEIQKRMRELGDAEAAVERFRSTANLFRGGGSQPSGLAEQQLTDLASELTKARGQGSEAEARARSARELIARGSPDAIPDVQKSPVIQGLIAQRVRAERDLAEAATQLLPAHPRMRQLKANVTDIRNHVAREAAIIVDGLEREARVLGLRAELTQKALDDAKSRVGDKAGDRVRLAQLEDDATAKRRELAALRDRFEASRSSSVSKAVPTEIQVIATATPSSRPSQPDRPKIAGLAAFATFLLGLVLVTFRELLAPGQQRAAHSARSEPALAGSASMEPATTDLAAPPLRPVQPVVAVPLALEPTVASAEAGTIVRKSAPSGLAPSPTASLSVAQAVQRLLGNSAGQSGYRTAIVGECPGIDVREEAADIAAALSAAGRQIVLIDWSLDGRGISEALGVPSGPGFTDLMAGTHMFEDVLRMLPDGDVHIVPCGAAVADANRQTLDADRLNMLLDALDEAFDDVVVAGSYAAVRKLFLGIEGRFDAGIMIASPDIAGPEASSTSFLGIDVTEIDVMRVRRPAGSLRARFESRERTEPQQSPAFALNGQ